MRVFNQLFKTRKQLTRLLSITSYRNYGAAAVGGYLREAYHCNGAWAKRLETPILQKVNVDDFFFEIDKKYQADKVLSAIDVDIFVNKVSDTETLDEIEELTYRLRKSPATADSLPSTSHAVIRAFLNGGRTDDLLRILNDRMNYGIFLDFHIANILMDEFIKSGNHRDAAKVAGLLMLEEDFGPSTTRFFALISCLKYVNEPKPDPWDPSPPAAVEESKEEVKVRVRFLRNPYFDEHFDLTEANQIVGKSLISLGKLINEDEVLSRSVELLGLAVYGRWEKVNSVVQNSISSNLPIAEETLKSVAELVEKDLSEIEASPTKSIPKPKIHRFPGMNLEDKEVAEFWDSKKIPDYSQLLPLLKTTLTSNKVPVSKDFNLISKAEKLLSAALSEREDKEIQEQEKTYEEWGKNRMDELHRQIQRFKANQILEDIEVKKQDLQEKEEVIFFFDHEEEWMMKLPADEQKGYKLSTEYKPNNQIKFVKTIPIKKIRKKKSKV